MTARSLGGNDDTRAAAFDERRRTSFNDRAEAYDAARPSYPEPPVREVLARTGTRSVLEVGAGTGQATTVLARFGVSVVALEPGLRLAAITYTLVEHPGYVVVVPIRDDGLVVMERVYRHTVQRTLLECPAGGLDGQDPETAARRELEEETGYVGGTWTSLGRFVGSSGASDEQFDVFLATGIRPGGTVRLEPGEQLTVELIPFDELRTRALRGDVDDAPSALAIVLAAQRQVRGASPEQHE